MSSLCCICLEEMNQNNQCEGLFVCCHSFHFVCISKWLSVKRNCPMCRQSMYHTKVKRDQSFQKWIQNYLFDLIVQLNSQIDDFYKHTCTVEFLQKLVDIIMNNTNLFLLCWNQHYKNELPEYKFQDQMTKFLNKQLLNTSVQTFQQY